MPASSSPWLSKWPGSWPVLLAGSYAWLLTVFPVWLQADVELSQRGAAVLSLLFLWGTAGLSSPPWLVTLGLTGFLLPAAWVWWQGESLHFSWSAWGAWLLFAGAWGWRSAGEGDSGFAGERFSPRQPALRGSFLFVWVPALLSALFLRQASLVERPAARIFAWLMALAASLFLIHTVGKWAADWQLGGRGLRIRWSRPASIALLLVFFAALSCVFWWLRAG